MDAAHVSTWFHCLIASTDLEHAIGPDSLDRFLGLLEFPPSYGGIGLQSPKRSADEELLGSCVDNDASPIAFCCKTELSVYIAIAEALKAMRDTTGLLEGDAENMEPDSFT
jgi:hypothetical protein